MAKFGEGHEQAMLKLARAFGEAGFEVIYTDLQDPRAIVASAIQESVDHIGITVLHGADIVTQFKNLFDSMKEHGISYIQVTAGGLLDVKYVPQLKSLGLVEFFPKGTTYDELINWAKKNIKAVE